MKQRVALPDFNQMWAGHVAASPSPRMHDDGAERAFWRDFMARKSYVPEPATRQVLRHLRPLLRALGWRPPWSRAPDGGWRAAARYRSGVVWWTAPGI